MENTIFFGNGINRLSDKNISWNHLLDKLKGTRKFKDDLLQNTMIFEKIILERPTKIYDLLHEEYDVKNEISNLMSGMEPNEIYTDLFHSGFQHYITTNYDYAFVDSIKDLQDINFPILEFSEEDVYSIRRLKQINNMKEQKKNFWQIHGEIRRPASIMLGLDHYCGSVGKIDSYIKGGYTYIQSNEKITEKSVEIKFKNNSFNNSSWIELFFTTNIYIIGFSLDFSEIDLWWILNKRARLMKSASLKNVIKNKIIFYDTNIDDQKKGLLESMNIKVNIQNLSQSTNKYFDYYKNLIVEIKKEF